MVKELFLYPGIYNLGYINPVQSTVVTAIPTLVDGMVEKEFFFHIGRAGKKSIPVIRSTSSTVLT